MSATPELAADVIVVGGGPAGSTAATMMARKGLRVLLLERDRFPRHHVGESLLPSSLPVLEELGVLPAVQAEGFLPKWGATMVWGRDRAPWSWYFSESNRRYPHSYQVWRPRFDQLLLENARANGVDVREGYRVTDVLFRGVRATGVAYTGPDGRPGAAGGPFVVDTSGQASLLAGRLDLRRWDSSFQNLAVYSYFTGAQRLPPPDENNIFIESYPSGWFWNIPLHTGWASVGVVVDSAAAQRGIRDRGAEGFFSDQISAAPHTREMLASAARTLGPFVARDWSYAAERFAGDGYVLAGDAACFVDPLFSSGVHLALTSGVLAAAYVVTSLRDPDLGRASASVYRELYYREYAHFRELARLFYHSNRTAESYFWEARRMVGDVESGSDREAFVRAVAGQPARGYERTVLGYGQPPGGFIQGLRQVEGMRVARRARLEGELSGEAIRRSVPRMSGGAALRRKPVVGEGEFQWGYVVTTPDRPEGIPCSDLVAVVVSMVDGKTSVGDILGRVAARVGEAQAEAVERSVVEALGIMYVDGVVEELESGQGG
ncbi:MAG: tryptophan 7-halogenase [Dehalococcoidia bacterium]|nr:tryptophan 7-halogenase [Dehalococcoidia bacterium]